MVTRSTSAENTEHDIRTLLDHAPKQHVCYFCTEQDIHILPTTTQTAFELLWARLTAANPKLPPLQTKEATAWQQAKLQTRDKPTVTQT